MSIGIFKNILLFGFDSVGTRGIVIYMLNDKDYQERVAKGKAGEKEILNILRARGIKIADPTHAEDMYDKIDGWMEWNGKKVAVQVKFRESGDDVLFEIAKDLDTGDMGRDMLCKAEFYLVRDRKGKIRMFSVAELKTKAKALYDFVLKDLVKNPDKENWGGWQGSNVNVKIVVDKAHGNRKLIAYFNPEKLKTLGEWN